MAGRELSQEQLERIVLGENPDPRITFFEQAMLDVAESKIQGRRCYTKRVMFKRVAPGCTDWTAALATKEHIAEYPDEYEYFARNKQGLRKPSIEIIPDLDILELQELLDYGLGTIEGLCEANVPPHLEHVKANAQIIHQAMKEIENGKQEESIQETSRAEDVPQADRRDNPVGERQPQLQARERSEERKAPQRIQESGQVNGSGGLARPFIIPPEFNVTIG